MYKFATFDQVLEKIDFDQPIAVDTETLSLYGKIRLLQVYQAHWQYCLLLDYPEEMELYVFLLELNKRDATLVFQNASYDITTIQKNTGSRWIPKNFHDTLLLARLAEPALDSYSLDSLLYTVLGFDPYLKHGIIKKDMQKANWKPLVLPDNQLAYAAIDTFYLLEVYKAFEPFIEDINYKIDIFALRHALDFQNNGLPVLQDALEKQYRSNIVQLDKLAMPINVNSWQQVRKYLDCEKSDALTLSTMFLEGDERAGNVVKAKKLLKQNSFLDKFATEDHRIYGVFAPLARSGRFTCKDQNLQQTPRAVKHIFGVPEDSDRVMLYADYPQLELRTIAAITNEQILVKLFKANGDPHNYVAQEIFGPSFTADDRQVTKTYNFNLLYVGGAGMIQGILIKQANVLRDMDVIRRDIRKWKRAWPSIAAWQEEVIRSHRKGTLRATPLGRRYLGRLVTDHANIENQGFGADVAKLALHYMADDLKANDALLCNFVHDSYMVEMPKDLTLNKKVAKLMKEAMKEAWFEACKAVDIQDIPMPAQVFCGYNLATIEKDFIFKED